MMTKHEIDACQAICSNIPMLNDIAKQLKIKNKIDLLRLKKDNGYVVKCSEINDLIEEIDKIQKICIIYVARRRQWKQSSTLS